MTSILVVDDERSMREFLSELLEKEGYHVRVAANGSDALAILDGEDVDLAIIDLKMPGMDGMELLNIINRQSPFISVIMMTAYGSERTAVEAMKGGASDYLRKPFDSLDELKLMVKRVLEGRRLKIENIYLRQTLKKQYAFKSIIGQSPKMKAIFDIMSRIANLDTTVLITGESGTGKELVASAIHYNSFRKDMPFVTVSCAALPENLLESELFGHTKGSFTGAVSNKIGLFELAQGGTFFLDEIGDAPPSIQVKLLRVLQNKIFKRVGGTLDIKVDVRIIAATNRNLEQAVAENSFREDLYYRLNVIPIHIPPLRERPEDIRLLADHFLALFIEKLKMPPTRFSEEVLDILLTCPWPGNVRQLENTIERLIALRTGPTITMEQLPPDLRQNRHNMHPFLPMLAEDGIDLEKIIENIERKYLDEALTMTRGLKKEAAELLNLSFRSFRYRLKKFNMSDSTEPIE